MHQLKRTKTLFSHFAASFVASALAAACSLSNPTYTSGSQGGSGSGGSEASTLETGTQSGVTGSGSNSNGSGSGSGSDSMSTGGVTGPSSTAASSSSSTTDGTSSSSSSSSSSGSSSSGCEACDGQNDSICEPGTPEKALNCAQGCVLTTLCSEAQQCAINRQGRAVCTSCDMLADEIDELLVEGNAPTCKKDNDCILLYEACANPDQCAVVIHKDGLDADQVDQLLDLMTLYKYAQCEDFCHCEDKAPKSECNDKNDTCKVD